MERRSKEKGSFSSSTESRVREAKKSYNQTDYTTKKGQILVIKIVRETYT
jgi:hypothetical protein